MKILLVEDDKPTAGVLSELLTTQYYTVDIATDGITGLELATTGDYELILLDLLIPKLDGISICRQLRAKGYQKPILLLTIKGASSDVVRGLDAGADDYVTKPYDLAELLARIRAMLRRGDQLAPALLIWENLCVNPVSAEVTYAGQLLNLTPKEYGLLGLFLRNPQRVFGRSDIIDRLWSIDAFPSEGAVTNLIKDLRQKLKSSGMSVDLLETIYGLGYRLRLAPPLQPQNLSQQQPKARRPKDLRAINQVLERYQNTFAARLVLLEQVEQALRTATLEQSLQQSAAQEAHRLAGTLGSFGYEQGSKIAQTLEHLLLGELTQAELPQLAGRIAELKQELTQPPKPYSIQQFEPVPIPVVLVIDPDLPFTAQLQADALAWGLQVKVAAELTLAQLVLGVTVVVLSLSHAAGLQLERLEQLKRDFPALPVLVITEQNDLSDRVAVARLGVQRFLSRPLTTAELFAAVAQVLPKPQTAEAKVLVLDDDAMMLVKISNLLHPWGLQVQTLQDPRQFWDLLVSTNPDLLIMDLEMPTFSGIDLCRVVRQDLKWGNLPILVVTAHTDINSVQQVFAAGADDFISKPLVGSELVTRVISRIDRSRLQQELETMKRRIGS